MAQALVRHQCNQFTIIDGEQVPLFAGIFGIFGHGNRLPALLLFGDVFANRRPDPVLQQVEHFGNPTISVTGV